MTGNAPWTWKFAAVNTQPMRRCDSGLEIKRHEPTLSFERDECFNRRSKAAGRKLLEEMRMPGRQNIDHKRELDLTGYPTRLVKRSN
jgi:hypothetical protein